MPATVQKWGNSLAIRLPKAIAEQSNLAEGSEVTIEGASGVITIRPAKRQRRRSKYRLEDLLAQIKPGQRHGEWDKSGPVGREVI